MPFLCVDQNTEITSSIKYQDSEEPSELVKTLIILKNIFNGIFICIYANAHLDNVILIKIYLTTWTVIESLHVKVT